jgi:hypothetical protein
LFARKRPPGLGLAFAAALCGPAAASAQDFDLIEKITDLISGVSDQTRDRMFDFLETVELWNPEAEVDRLVGNPWELGDSTTYKLRLLPLFVTNPIHAQLVRQMTRLDDLRSQRIYNVTPDSVEKIAVKFDSESLEAMQRDVATSVLRTFNVREIADLAVFGLAQQPLFPTTDAEWQHRKRRLSEHKGAVLTTALAAGALFEAGAFSQSGGVASWGAAKEGDGGDRYRLRWYGGLRRLGFRGRPQLRAGLTTTLPGVELAAGVSEQIRPLDSNRRRAVEIAFREGLLGRITRPSGWDVFFESALREVLSAQPGYTGEKRTGRAGLFFRRDNPARIRDLVFRSSAEMELDFARNNRFAAGVGVEHTRTGLATVLQASRTAVLHEGTRTQETRAGLFIAGTMEPPSAYFVDAMNMAARRVHQHWEAVAAAGVTPGAGTDPATVEDRILALASDLAGYLENRRRAYSILRWPTTDGDLHGPLDGGVLTKSRQLVLARLYNLAAYLERGAVSLDLLQRQSSAVQDAISRLAPGPGDAPLREAYRDRLAGLDRDWRAESDRVRTGVRAYEHYRECARRMDASSRRAAPALDTNPLSREANRRVKLLAAAAPLE